jgi:hypothetical protein
MLDSNNKFFGFCGILCDSGKVDESAFEQFLFSLHPVSPTIAPFDINDKSAVDQFVAQYVSQLSQLSEKRLNNIKSFAMFSGCNTNVYEIKKVLDMMINHKIDESDFEKVFRRWRETKTPSTVSVLRQEKQQDDMTLVNPFITPLIKGPIVDSWGEYISNINEFEKAIRWVRRWSRISKAKTAWREQKGNIFLVIIAVLYELFIALVSWAILIPVAIWLWDWVRSKKRH